MATQKYRTFPENRDEGQNPLNILARVTIHRGGGNNFHTTPGVDNITGRVIVSPEYLYKDIRSKTDFQKRQPASSITLEVMKGAADEGVVILQRQNGDRYLEVANMAEVGLAQWFIFPPCKVNYRLRTPEEMAALDIYEPRVVWTQTNQKSGPNNRADVFQIIGDRVSVDGIFPITLDQGESFQVIRETRWAGSVRRRTNPNDYQVVSDDARVSATYAERDVASFLREYALVPDEGFGNFELKGQLLLHKVVRDLLRAGATKMWTGNVDFWVKPKARVTLTDQKTALVQMYLHGMSDPAQGFVQLATPISVGGRLCDVAQIRHHFIDCDEDPQGLKRIRPGDIITFDKLVSMDNKGGEYPPLALGVRVIYEMREAA